MVGRFLALCGWLARQVRRPFSGRFLRRLGGAPVVVLAIALLAAAATPIIVPLVEPQPETTGVQAIFDDAVTHPEGWVRLRGRLVPLDQAPTGRRGPFALLVDADEPLRAIVVVTEAGPADETTLTGRLEPAAEVAVTEELPIEATVAGTPPRVVPDRVLVADEVAAPEREVWWPLAIPPAVLAALLLVGLRAGYPVFRQSVEIAVLVRPLGPGERLPAAYGGRIGQNERDLADPGAALLLVSHGESGNRLTAQPLPDDGGAAPAAVPIGGSWTSGRIGYVFTVSEVVPALVVRSERVAATFLFARVSERDRIAALVAVER